MPRSMTMDPRPATRPTPLTMSSHGNDAATGEGDASAEPMKMCAACSTRGSGLKQCTACKSVHYCNVDCQRGHRKVHKKECKQRAAELATLRDLENFVPPPREDCPVCMIPMPLEESETMYMACCGKKLCCGCSLASGTAQLEGGASVEHATRCAFCREPLPDTTQDGIARLAALVDKNDPKATVLLAGRYRKGGGVPMDKHKAFSLYCRAAEQGDPKAVGMLFHYYNDGIIVRRDESKATRLLKQAADGGHILSRHNLGILEASQGNNRAAMLHYRIAAAAGHENSLKALKEQYKAGHVSKKELAGSLRDFQAAQDEMKSEAREIHRRQSKDGLEYRT